MSKHQALSSRKRTGKAALAPRWPPSACGSPALQVAAKAPCTACAGSEHLHLESHRAETSVLHLPPSKKMALVPRLAQIEEEEQTSSSPVGQKLCTAAAPHFLSELSMGACHAQLLCVVSDFFFPCLPMFCVVSSCEALRRCRIDSHASFGMGTVTRRSCHRFTRDANVAVIPFLIGALQAVTVERSDCLLLATLHFRDRFISL